jgi:hypothetical protein
MVLAPKQARKGQTRLLLHRRPLAFRSRIFQPAWLCGRLRNSYCLSSQPIAYCAVTLNVIASELEIGFAPPVVALIVTA